MCKFLLNPKINTWRWICVIIAYILKKIWITLWLLRYLIPSSSGFVYEPTTIWDLKIRFSTIEHMYPILSFLDPTPNNIIWIHYAILLWLWGATIVFWKCHFFFKRIFEDIYGRLLMVENMITLLIRNSIHHKTCLHQ